MSTSYKAYFLDIRKEDLDRVDEMLRTTNHVPIPNSSFTHPSDPNVHRMEFVTEDDRNSVKNYLGRHGIETRVVPQ